MTASTQTLAIAPAAPFKNGERLCPKPEGYHPDTGPTRPQADALARAQTKY